MKINESIRALATWLIDHGVTLEDSQREFERCFVEETLRRNRGNHCRTADLLGVHRNTLARRMAMIGVDRRTGKPARP